MRKAWLRAAVLVAGLLLVTAGLWLVGRVVPGLVEVFIGVGLLTAGLFVLYVLADELLPRRVR